MKKIIYDKTIIDYQSGETKREEIIYQRETEPSFVKVYIDCLCSFKGISKSLNPILLELLKYMTYADSNSKYGGQIIYLNKQLKNDIAKSTGVTIKRIEQAITDFTKTGIFNRVSTGTYQVNAELFGKGDWKDIKNIISVFDFKEESIKTDIIK